MAKRTEGKGKDSKEGRPDGGAVKSAPAKGAASKGNGSAPQQPELDFAAKSAAGKAPAVAPAEPVQPPADPIVVVELVNGVDGVWKKLSNGKRVDLTTKEWRQELARLFTRAPAP